MPDYMAAAFAEHEARYRMAVMADTWGHLDARPGVTYPGFIVYAVTAWGQTEPIEAVFGHIEGPGYFDHMNNFIDDDGRDRDVGVYRFDGTYSVSKRGAAQWNGSTATLATFPADRAEGRG